MTGINPKNKAITDSPQERYIKYKHTAEKFKIIQMGITTFKKKESWNESLGQKAYYECKPYNAFLFPEDNSGNNLITCETSAIILNRENKVDFNKWIYEGKLILILYRHTLHK